MQEKQESWRERQEDSGEIFETHIIRAPPNEDATSSHLCKPGLREIR
jgi:hypothetical protein